MIIVIVEVDVEAGAADQVRSAIAAMETATRAEGGCELYAFSVDVSDDSKIRVIERWRSMDDIKAHMASPHMAEFNRAMGAIRPKGLSIKAYEVEREVALG
ncbi:MAG TPA: putative quinol monooxygenase [Candidatus Binatia bacterium]|nr:putative quinol monooxygenase [Candidatus Binatia bacterium]